MGKYKPLNVHDWGQNIVKTSAGDVPRSLSYPQSKRMRDFVLTVGLPDNEYGRKITVRARSNFEAGLNVLIGGLVPVGYVAHSLVEASGKM